MDNEDKALNEVLSSFSTGDLVMEIRDRIGTDITVALTIFINANGYRIQEENRPFSQLKEQSITMRNVFGRVISGPMKEDKE